MTPTNNSMEASLTTLELEQLIKRVGVTYNLNDENAKQLILSQMIDALDVKKVLAN